MDETMKRVVINALIVALITLFSTLSIVYPPTAQNMWAAFIGGMLAFLTQVKQLFLDPLTEVQVKKLMNKKPPIGMLI